MTKTKESTTYNQMLRQVEKIVNDMDDQETDLDSMVKKLEQGFALIKTMRERLDTTKNKVESLRDKFET